MASMAPKMAVENRDSSFTEARLSEVTKGSVHPLRSDHSKNLYASSVGLTE